MDIEKLIHCLQCCARVDAHNVGCDDCGLEYCGPECQQLCGTAATALSTIQAENEKLKDQLYDGEGVNLVNYWMQQAKIEENGHRNCQAENEKLRSDLRRLQTERDTLLAANQHLMAERDQLTLERLREMDGEPVWIVDVGPHKWYGPGWAIVDRDNCLVRTVKNWNPVFFEKYGERWLAYCRPPERQEDT